MDGLSSIYDPRSHQPSSAHHSPTSYPHSGGPAGISALQYGGYGGGGGGPVPQVLGVMGGGPVHSNGGAGGVSSDSQVKRDKDSVYG